MKWRWYNDDYDEGTAMVAPARANSGKEFAESILVDGITLLQARAIVFELNTMVERIDSLEANDLGIAHRSIDALERQLATMKDALETIAYSGTDCAPGDFPEGFYRDQMYKSIGTAARALAALAKEEGQQ